MLAIAAGMLGAGAVIGIDVRLIIMHVPLVFEISASYSHSVLRYIISMFSILNREARPRSPASSRYQRTADGGSMLSRYFMMLLCCSYVVSLTLALGATIRITWSIITVADVKHFCLCSCVGWYLKVQLDLQCADVAQLLRARKLVNGAAGGLQSRVVDTVVMNPPFGTRKPGIDMQVGWLFSGLILAQT
eukprot:SAG31_NODE_637_length_13337_cov_23.061867_3_plen_190_part_00